MIIRTKSKQTLSIVSLIVLTQLVSCNPDATDDPITYINFANVYININLPQYTPQGHPGLKTDGGFVYYDDAGVKGLIIYRQNATTFHVYERNCSYHPNEACTTVNVHVSTLYMEDPCCGSTFELITGNPTGGVAWRPLRKYFCSVSGTDLTITDEILN